tara:strand:- start:18792 stop:19085 length:294 start_codon:yes stop_codon:yes gene_type:complete
MNYSINELPTDKDLKAGLKYSLTEITEGDSRNTVIADAEDYYRDKAIDNGVYGDGEQEVVLVVTDCDTEREYTEVITLTWFADDFNEAREHSTHWGL